MGLFAKQPAQLKQNIPYTVSFANKTKLIVGLGNPGKEYEMSRHNTGYIIIDQFAVKNNFLGWRLDKQFKGYITENKLGSTRTILLKPNTFMNLSGESVIAVMNYYKINLKDILVIYDELSIPFGTIRSRVGGQSAGHNGIKSLIEHIKPDFGRIKIGIKNSHTAKLEQSKFVLEKFSKKEQDNLNTIISEACGLITESIFGDSVPIDSRKVLLN